jgi:glutamyl-tRNA synthetase
MEDLDQQRVRPEARASILADLSWLGLDWDEGPLADQCGLFDQSCRDAMYRREFDRLQAQGLLYPCTCSRKDAAEAAGAPHAANGQTIYPGTCRRKAVKSGPLCWRLAVPPGTLHFVDGILGTKSQEISQQVGDFVILRADGVWSYQFACVVDDALMGVTQVVRGADLLESTARQILLFQLLGYEPPRYWHYPLRLDDLGRKLSKRDQACSLSRLREQGVTRERVLDLLSSGLGPLLPKCESAAQLLAALRRQPALFPGFSADGQTLG